MKAKTTISGNNNQRVCYIVNFQIVKGAIPPIDLRCFKVVEEETDAIYHHKLFYTSPQDTN